MKIRRGDYMDREDILKFIDYYKKWREKELNKNVSDITPYHHSVISFLERFLEKNDMTGNESETDIINRFFAYLEEKGGDKIFDPSMFPQPSRLYTLDLCGLLCQFGQPVATSYLLNNKFITKETKDQNSNTALHFAALAGSAKGMQDAIDAGFDPKIGTDDGIRIFSYAALSGNIAAIQKAIDLGFDPKTKDKNGKYYLDYIRDEEARDYVKALYNVGDYKLPKSQEWFIKLLQDIGYKGNEDGMCYGVAQMAMQAALAGETDNFNARFGLIAIYRSDPEKLKHDINEARNAVKNKKPLTQTQEKFLEIQAFFDGIELYQVGYKEHKEIIGSELAISQSDHAKKLLPLLIPEKLEKNNGQIEKIIEIKTDYEDKNVEDFLAKIKKICESIDFPISFTLSKADKNGGHAINLSFSPQEKCWILIDANKLPAKKFALDDMQSLKKAIDDSLNLITGKKPTFEVEAFLHNDDTKLAKISDFKFEMKKALVPQTIEIKKPLTVGQRIRQFAKKHPVQTALFGVAALAAIAGIVTLSVLTAGAGTAILAAIVAPPLLVIAVGGNVTGAVMMHIDKAEKKTGQKKYGNENIEDKLNKYIYLKVDGKTKRFGKSSSELQTRYRHKVFDYMNALNSSNLSTTDKENYLNMLQKAMYDFEKASSKNIQSAEKILKAVFVQIDATLKPKQSSTSTVLVGKTIGGMTPPQQATPSQPPSPSPLKSPETAINVLFNLKQTHGDSRSTVHAAMRQGYADRLVTLETLSKGDASLTSLKQDMERRMDNLEKSIKGGDAAEVKITVDALKQCYQQVDKLIEARKSVQPVHTPSAPRM